jgi:hypothetical protein
MYKTIPIAYSCLNNLGYNYRHEDLEALPSLVGELKALLQGAKGEIN